MSPPLFRYGAETHLYAFGRQLADRSQVPLRALPVAGSIYGRGDGGQDNMVRPDGEDVHVEAVAAVARAARQRQVQGQRSLPTIRDLGSIPRPGVPDAAHSVGVHVAHLR